MKVYGIDVSRHQGTINWDVVAAELRRVNGDHSPGFAIIRAGTSDKSRPGGLWEDPQARRNLAECNRLGIPCGVYVYCYDQSAQAASITMSEALELVKPYQLDYPVVYDVEYEQYNVSASKKANTDMILAAMATVEGAGYYGMVYCSRDFFLNHTNLTDLSAIDKWEAAYTQADTDQVPNGIWQFSSKNTLNISGFGNSLDCDVAYKDYPAIIKAAGLNGYGKPETSPVAAERYSILIREVTGGDMRTVKAAIAPTLESLNITDRLAVMAVL